MKEMLQPKGIVIHTAAFHGAVDVNTIRQWHLERGFADIGYHFVITGSKYDSCSEIQAGRSLKYQGAHAKGSNDYIGVCFTGHGDLDPFTAEQLAHFINLYKYLKTIFDLKFYNVIGHRETPYEQQHANKTCPGLKVNMHEIRNMLRTIDLANDYEKNDIVRIGRALLK